VARTKVLERFPISKEKQDIAAVVAFLASPDGSWINGQVLRGKGGMI
jgi:NAD(P)-dependent dehydrogenase (short-subunit alcohol dehydrogenase family)